MVRRPGTARALGAVACALGFTGTGGAAGAEAPGGSCRGKVESDRDTVYVGQAIEQRVRIETDDPVIDATWIAPESSPRWRMEWLPGRSSTDGDGTRQRVERRGLFARSVGRSRLPAGSIRCRLATQETVEVALEAPSVSVLPVPTDDRPATWSGLVGRPSIQTLVTPEKIALGGSVRVAIMIRGGNVWSLTDPLSSLPGADVFPVGAETRIDRGESLSATRHFAYDVVPVHEGEWSLPTIAIDYFDPDAAAYARVTTEPRRVLVAPRAAGPGASGEPSLDPPEAFSTPANARDREPAAPTWASPALWALAFLAALAASAFWWARRTQRPAAAGDGAAAASAGDSAPSAALRERVEDAFPAGAGLPAEEILARSDLPEAIAEAAKLLAALERARFLPGAPQPSHAEVERVLTEIGGRRSGRRHSR